MNYEFIKSSKAGFSTASLCEEWDWKVAVEVSREEGREVGIQKGREVGIEEGIVLEQNRILDLLTKGRTLEEIKRELTLQQEM